LDRTLVILECLNVIVLPLVYDGLMAISYMIHDPFGPEMLDYPVKAYTACIVDNCYAFQHASDKFPGCFPPGEPSPVTPLVSPAAEPTSSPENTGPRSRKTYMQGVSRKTFVGGNPIKAAMGIYDAGDDDDGGGDD
jgi:hypothetical protein